MSTIKVNNLQNASGGSNSTPEEIQQGRAKAWVNFQGTSTVTIRDDYNVSSVTDHATGQYTVNLSNAMGNANYAFGGMVSSEGDTGHESDLSKHGGRSITTTAMPLRITRSDNLSYVDKTYVTCLIFGD
jgi:hypothetical protein